MPQDRLLQQLLGCSLNHQHPQVKQVTAGGMHSVVLLTSGKVFTAGVNDEGPLGRPTGAGLLPTCLMPCILQLWRIC